MYVQYYMYICLVHVICSIHVCIYVLCICVYVHVYSVEADGDEIGRGEVGGEEGAPSTDSSTTAVS